jgi:hypothetical protein
MVNLLKKKTKKRMAETLEGSVKVKIDNENKKGLADRFFCIYAQVMSANKILH